MTATHAEIRDNENNLIGFVVPALDEAPTEAVIDWLDELAALHGRDQFDYEGDESGVMFYTPGCHPEGCTASNGDTVRIDAATGTVTIEKATT